MCCKVALGTFLALLCTSVAFGEGIKSAYEAGGASHPANWSEEAPHQQLGDGTPAEDAGLGGGSASPNWNQWQFVHYDFHTGEWTFGSFDVPQLGEGWDNFDTVAPQADPAPVPEPATLGLGAAALGLLWWRRGARR